MAEVAIVLVCILKFVKEVEAVRAASILRGGCRAPIVAERTIAVELISESGTCSRQEDTIAVRAYNFVAINTV